MALIGWRVQPEERIDAGVPREVAGVLARALAGTALVTFPTSEPCATTSETDTVQVLEATGVFRRLRDHASRTPSRIFLVSTRQAETVRALFEDGLFPWWMQGTLALLGAPQALAPRIARERLLSIMDLPPVDWSSLSELGVAAVLVPGVDGDVAALFSSASEFEGRFLSALEREARAADFEWVVSASEDDFAEQLR
jgi:hypothetical protein